MAQYKTGQKTCDEIIEAAGELAAERGLDNFTTRQVAERAGVNVGSIHYHFGGKDGLLEALARDLTHDWVNHPLDAVITANNDNLDTPEGKIQLLRAIIRRHMDLFHKNKHTNWHSRVFYQILQHKTNITRIVEQDMLDPTLEALRDVFYELNPKMTDYERLHCITILTAPLCFHCDYMTVILEELGEDKYNEEYLTGLEEMILKNLAQALEIPLP